MIYLVYKIINKIDNKIYIGTHKTKNKDDGYMGSGKYLNRAIKKYGKENFIKEILFEYDNPTEMFAKEAAIVNEDFLSTENTYNLKIGGFGGFDYINENNLNLLGIKNRTETSFLKMSEGAKNSILTNPDTHFSNKDFRDKARYTRKLNKNYNSCHIGSKRTQETKDKMSVSHIGEKNSQYGSMWITNGIESKKIKKGDDIPVGWIIGRKYIGSRRIDDASRSERE